MWKLHAKRIEAVADAPRLRRAKENISVVPQQEAGTLLFTDMECARVHLICTLHYEIENDAGTLPVVLSLVDQLYDTRQRPLSLTAAITAQDKIQAAIIAAMEPNGRSSAADKS